MKPDKPRKKPVGAPVGALALAIERGDWERVGLSLLLGLALALRDAPPETIDNLLELLSQEEARGRPHERP